MRKIGVAVAFTATLLTVGCVLVLVGASAGEDTDAAVLNRRDPDPTTAQSLPTDSTPLPFVIPNQTTILIDATGNDSNPHEALIVAIAAAIVGGIITGIGKLCTVDRERSEGIIKAQIEVVDKQLREFYAPLLAEGLYSRKVLDEFKERVKSRRGVKGGAEDWWPATESLDEEFVLSWRRTCRDVLFPSYKRCKEIILHKAHLVEGERPELLKEATAHYASWQVLSKTWPEYDRAAGAGAGGPPLALDRRSNIAQAPFPEGFHAYLEYMHKQLVTKRAKLFDWTDGKGTRFTSWACIYRGCGLSTCVEDEHNWFKLVDNPVKYDQSGATNTAKNEDELREEMKKEQVKEVKDLSSKACNIVRLVALLVPLALLLFLLWLVVGDWVQAVYTCDSIGQLLSHRRSTSCFDFKLSKLPDEERAELYRLMDEGFWGLWAVCLLVFAPVLVCFCLASCCCKRKKPNGYDHDGKV
jgi:hypothetical protein